MTVYVNRRHFRKASGRMFKSVDWTFTYYQGCGNFEHDEPSCPVCWTKWFVFGPISRLPKLMWEDPQAIIPEDFHESVIFLNSAHDSLAPVIPEAWIRDMAKWMGLQHPSIEFYIQSKWIHRARKFYDLLHPLRDRLIMGTTLMTTDQDLLNRFSFLIPSIDTRFKGLYYLKSAGFRVRLSLEPLYKFDVHEMAKMVLALQPELVELGLDNYMKQHELEIPQPSREDCLELKDIIEENAIIVHLKASMEKYLGVKQ